MNTTSTTWRCHRCATTGTGDAPWYGLCDQCLANLQSLALQVLPDTTRCPSCGGPVCPHCGDAMPILVAVPAPDGNPAIQQATALMIGYQACPDDEGMTGDEH